MLGAQSNKLDVWVDFYAHRNPPPTGSMPGYAAHKISHERLVLMVCAGYQLKAGQFKAVRGELVEP